MSAVAERLTAVLADRYAIEREIGEGGMATVFLAIDARHERRVAIKVLHPELSAMLGPDRFLSEIKLTASLQHPNILPLFDSGVADGLLYYVMPFVEGETLRRRLDRERQLPIADAVRLATEIADALQYAHERGIVHRDIKPENVLLQSGRAVVADFGIALAVQQAGGTRMTQTGMSLGTPQYMAPEQAMGERNIDARADVYALGVMTYEMLAGEPPFTGPTAQAIVAKVMTERARSLSASRDTVPAYIDDAVATAIAKLPADRFASASLFAQGIDAATHASGARTNFSGATRRSVATNASATRTTIIAVVALLLGAVGALGIVRARGGNSGASSELAVRFAVTTPDSVQLRLICCGQLFAISHDGRWLVFQGSAVAADAKGRALGDYDLYLRDLTDVGVRRLPGTTNATSIFFSPDNNEIGFVVGQELRRLSLSGTESQSVAPVPEGYVGGAHWGDDGDIVIAVTGRLLHVKATGGTLATLVPDDSIGRQVGGPQRVPGENVLLYTIGSFTETPRVIWRSLTKGTSKIVAAGATPTYLASAHALLLVRDDGTLVRYPFDIATGDTLGPPSRLAPYVARRSPIVIHAEYSVSDNGTLILATRREARESSGVTIVDLEHGATVTSVLKEYRSFASLMFSPTSERIEFEAALREKSAFVPYILDPRRNAVTRLQIDGRMNATGWNATGDTLLYATSATEILSRAIDGTAASTRVLAPRDWKLSGGHIAAWGPWLAFSATAAGSDGLARIVIAHRDSLGVAHPFDDSRYAEQEPTISPDGKWMAFMSRENGHYDVFIAAFPRPQGRILVSTKGGESPRWGRDSRTLYFESGNQIMSATVSAGSPPQIGTPTSVYQRAPWGTFDIAPDGKSLIFVDRAREGDPQSLVVGLHAVTRP